MPLEKRRHNHQELAVAVFVEKRGRNGARTFGRPVDPGPRSPTVTPFDRLRPGAGRGREALDHGRDRGAGPGAGSDARATASGVLTGAAETSASKSGSALLDPEVTQQPLERRPVGVMV